MTTNTAIRRTLSGDLARAVMLLVNDQGLRPGDALESAQALASRFDVAVPTMREALRRLEGLGVLELRHGSGIYVGANSGRRVLPNPLSPQPDHGQLLEILDARLQIEPQLARRAAEVREPIGLQWMEETLEFARQQVAEEDDALWLTNLDFHRAVATTAGNTVLAEVLDSILLVHGEAQREILRLHGDAAEDHAEHIGLAEAVRSGRPDDAHTVAHNHLEHVATVIRSRTA